MIGLMSDTDRLLKLMLRHSNIKDLNNCPNQKYFEDEENEQIEKEKNRERTKKE